MTVRCLECSRDFKRLNVFHLRMHVLDERSYLLKYPGASLFSQETIDNISRGTRDAMARPDVRKRFMDHMSTRDISGERNPFYGKKHSDESKKSISDNKERSRKISVKKSEWWSTRRGKTVEELFGEETGRRIRAIKSEQMMGEKSPLFGKVHDNVGGKYRGYYKGKLFRSLFEYSFYKHLERRGTTIDLIQHEGIRIPYVLRGKLRTYIPDFLVGTDLFEIKGVDFQNGKMYEAKCLAARQYCATNGLSFSVLTQRDFKIINSKTALLDPDVVWLKRGGKKMKRRKRSI